MISASEAIVGVYERHAQAFDARRGRTLFEKPWLDRFASLLSPGARILDLGCGTGEPIAHYLAGKGFSLTGVDSAPSMIALCRARLPDQDWIVADMRTLALGRGFDGILAWDSFFHLAFDDQRRMFEIFREHSAPGAALLFTSGPAYGEAIGSFEGEPLYHASLAPSEYESLLSAHGFQVAKHVAEDPDCGGHTIWLARLAAQLP